MTFKKLIFLSIFSLPFQLSYVKAAAGDAADITTLPSSSTETITNTRYYKGSTGSVSTVTFNGGTVFLDEPTNTVTFSGCTFNPQSMLKVVNAGPIDFSTTASTFEAGSIAAMYLAGGGNVTFTKAPTLDAGRWVDIIESCTLILNDNFSGNIHISAGKTLTIQNSNDKTLSGIISGAGNILKTGAGTLTLSGANTSTGALSANSGSIILTNTYAGTITPNNGSVTLPTLNLLDGQTYASPLVLGANITQALNISAGTSATISGVISGAGNLNILGGGTLTLSGANTFSGPLNINAGTLIAANANALGANNGGDITMNGDALIFTAPMTSNRNITLSHNSTIEVTNATDTLTLGGVISGVKSITKTGLGQLSLTGANTFTGGLTLSAGSLRLANDASAGSGTLITSNGTSLIIPASLNIANSITLYAGTTTFNILNATDTVKFSGAISGLGALNKTGPGTLTLSATNSYTGGTTISTASKVNISITSAFGANDGTITINAPCTFGFGDTLYTFSIPQDIVLAAALTCDVATGSTGTLLGDISGTGSLIKTGSGTLTLSSSNTNSFTGGLFINGGRVDSSGGAGASFGFGAVTKTANGSFTTKNGQTITPTTQATYTLA